MTQWSSFIFAPGERVGCLPIGEARGGDFALIDMPHPVRDLFPVAKVRIVLKPTSEIHMEFPATGRKHHFQSCRGKGGGP